MTIADIANMAGVSKAAVSRYFNNGYISDEKREAIRKVVEETGYQPSVHAQTLRTKKTKMVGVIVPKMVSSALGRVIEGIQNVLDEAGYQLLLTVTHNDLEREITYLQNFDETKVDGVILCGTMFTAEHKRIIKNMNIPLVIVGQRFTGLSCVYHDDYHMTYDVTKRIIEKGAKAPAFMGVNPQDQAVGMNRYRGFCDAVREAGLEECIDRRVVANFRISSGYEKAAELLELYPNLDAIICATDELAAGSLRYLQEQHIAVPEEVRLAGHGDSSLVKIAGHDIMTGHFAYEESGKLAAEILLEEMTNPEAVHREIMLGYSIVE